MDRRNGQRRLRSNRRSERSERWVFHYIFSRDAEENKQALIAIINVILGREADPIESIQIMNPYIYGEKPYMKGAVLDIKAQTSLGELLDIEMQNGNLEFYADRSVFYCGKLINLSLEKGEDYDKMKKSIVISIVKGNVLPQTKKLHSTFYFLESEEHFRLSETAEIHFVELEKVDVHKSIEEMDPLERLAAYMLFAGDRTQEMYVQDLIERGGEAVTMAERLFKELTEDQIAFEMREQQIKTEHALATLRFVEEKRKAELAQKEADMQKKEADVQKKEADVQKKEADVQKKEADVQKKEADVQKKEADVQKKEADVQKKEAEVESRQDELDIQQRALDIQQKELDVQQQELDIKQQALSVQQEQLHAQRRSIAITLKKAGIDVAQISILTGLSIEEVSSL
ncbi:Rpn family recombination-promoting nuclease/putative transposase [Anaerotruncus sp. 80]|uniref:Rpn family recombination-promoting nuclease/putative transposase n=2 Tax=Clostridia TaxID=186801 RepID=A0A845QJG7_9FIRM|nr:Rpn family recombination-promoting nuclease/putative transposase [Anaerotruncus colihominis]NCF02987.1 Rpn family recombination-promoting nuclease/putative transposase [Anaerotruncus sp. 80]